jgi:energy-coupling factor transport system permease protein
MAILSLTRNPWYIGLALGWISLIHIVTRPPAGDGIARAISPLRFALVVIPFSALLNGLAVHFGRNILFTIPAFIPWLAGPVTLEALVYGGLNGLVLAGLFAAFVVINRTLSVRAIIRLIPRAFYPAAVVVSIAVTFIPVTLRQFQQIREAQAIRGRQLAGLQAWLPLLMPLLTGGLERAMQLAEAMAARGFAGAPRHDLKTRLALAAGLLALLSGWLLRLVWDQAGWGLGVWLAGVVLVLGTLWLVGRRTPHTVYRPEPWRWPEWSVTASALLAAGLFVFPWPGLDRSSIFYYPYPALTWPGFDLALGAATVGLATPAVWAARRE